MDLLFCLHVYFRFVTKLLEDLIFFVCVVPNNGQDVLSVVTSTPNRERQKLMREQNILAQVSTHTHPIKIKPQNPRDVSSFAGDVIWSQNLHISEHPWCRVQANSIVNSALPSSMSFHSVYSIK